MMTKQTHTSAASTANPAADALAWAAALPQAGIYAGLYKEALSATARRLQGQAEFLQKLADCAGPAELLTCSSEFVQTTVADCLAEGQRTFSTLLTPASRPR